MVNLPGKRQKKTPDSRPGFFSILRKNYFLEVFFLAVFFLAVFFLAVAFFLAIVSSSIGNYCLGNSYISDVTALLEKIKRIIDLFFFFSIYFSLLLFFLKINLKSSRTHSD